MTRPEVYTFLGDRTIKKVDQLYLTVDATLEELETQPLIPREVTAFTTDVLRLLEGYDPHTTAHSLEVGAFMRTSRLLENASNLSDEMMIDILAEWISGITHDIGKIRIPKGILLKPSSLTPVELDIIRQHPQLGEDFLKQWLTRLNINPEGEHKFWWNAIQEVMLYHHEDFDGGGYPYGLQGNQIPLRARRARIWDTASALMTARPYHPLAADIDTTRNILLPMFEPGVVNSQQRGPRADPAMRNNFLKIFNRISSHLTVNSNEKIPIKY